MDDNQSNPVGTLFEKAENYGKTTLELIKLDIVEKSADIVSSLAVQLIIAMMGVLFLFTLNIGIALWIGELLGKSYYGFLVVAVGDILIAVLIHALRDQLIKEPIGNSIIRQMLKQKIA